MITPLMRKFSVLVLLPLLLTGCFEKKGEILARFDGRVITEADFIQRLRHLPPEYRSASARNRKVLLEEMINEHFLAKEARRRGIGRIPEVREVMATARDKITSAKLLDLEINQNLKIAPGEAERFYELNKEKLVMPLRLRVSHILAATQAEGDAIKKELDAGADFAEIARRKSGDGTSTKGGDIGYIQKGQLIPEFEEKVMAMGPGEVSPAFKTQFGYHILKVTERKEPQTQPFEEVRPLIERQLVAEKKAKTYREFMNKIKGRAKVQIDEAKLSALDLQDAGESEASQAA